MLWGFSAIFHRKSHKESRRSETVEAETVEAETVVAETAEEETVVELAGGGLSPSMSSHSSRER